MSTTVTILKFGVPQLYTGLVYTYEACKDFFNGDGEFKGGDMAVVAYPPTNSKSLVDVREMLSVFETDRCGTLTNVRLNSARTEIIADFVPWGPRQDEVSHPISDSPDFSFSIRTINRQDNGPTDSVEVKELVPVADYHTELQPKPQKKIIEIGKQDFFNRLAQKEEKIYFSVAKKLDCAEWPSLFEDLKHDPYLKVTHKGRLTPILQIVSDLLNFELVKRVIEETYALRGWRLKVTRPLEVSDRRYSKIEIIYFINGSWSVPNNITFDNLALSEPVWRSRHQGGSWSVIDLRKGFAYTMIKELIFGLNTRFSFADTEIIQRTGVVAEPNSFWRVKRRTVNLTPHVGRCVLDRPSLRHFKIRFKEQQSD